MQWLLKCKFNWLKASHQRKVTLKMISLLISARNLEKCFQLLTEEHGQEYFHFELWLKTLPILTCILMLRIFKSYLLDVVSTLHFGILKQIILILNEFIILRLILKRLQQRKFIWLLNQRTYQRFCLGTHLIISSQIRLLFKLQIIHCFILIFDRLKRQQKLLQSLE